MSDLAATNCGGCSDCNGGCSSCFWIICLLLLCGGCGSGNSTFGGGGCGNDSCTWIILLLLFCGGGCGNNGLFSNNGCGCGAAATNPYVEDTFLNIPDIY